MEWWFLAGYIVSLLICWACYVGDAVDKLGPYGTTFKQKLTWGILIRALWPAVVPAVNTMIALMVGFVYIYEAVGNFVNDMDNKNVFKEKRNEHSEKY